jgi:hypothetical protein
MSRDMESINAGALPDGPLRLLCSATADWTDGGGNSVSTTTTSGIYKMKLGDRVIIAISADSDGSAILMLPSVAAACGRFFSISAPTGLAGGDISVYDEESGAEISTYGQLDANGDDLLVFSTGTEWIPVLSNLS